MRTRLLLIMLVFSGSISAEIYKCTDAKGRPQFSDQPCAENAETVEVKTQTSGIGVAPQGDYSGMLEANRERDRTRAIAGHERNIIDLQNERDAQLARLRARQTRANNNLAGATYRQSLASEMQSVSQDYNARIQSERDIIRDLRQQ